MTPQTLLRDNYYASAPIINYTQSNSQLHIKRVKHHTREGERVPRLREKDGEFLLFYHYASLHTYSIIRLIHLGVFGRVMEDFLATFILYFSLGKK